MSKPPAPQPAPPQPKPPKTRDLMALRQIMADLRDPHVGCPWDVEQDFGSISPYTIEEAYEVADAIERGSMDDLKSELGDLLLQVVYHSQMAHECEAFNLDDVIVGICDKMIRRHPHVYGTADDGGRPTIAKGFWEDQKAEERRQAEMQSHGEGGNRTGATQGVLADIPRNLPALNRAVKLQGRAARVGFDWPDTGPVFAKLAEEVGELQAAIDAGEPQVRLTEELGDILFVLANLGRHLGLDAEAALATTNAKFTRRFAYIEAQLAKAHKTPSESNLEEMDKLWDDAKRHEKEDQSKD